MSRLVLVRHCEPEEDARGLCYGRLDIGLSPAGRAHAERLAPALARLQWEAVYTSPRRRAGETAAAHAAARGLEPQLEDGQCEQDPPEFIEEAQHAHRCFHPLVGVPA